MSYKRFFLSFVVVYVFLSLPAMFSVGYVIDWVPETTFLQKFKVYVFEGILNNYVLKIIVSAILSLLFIFFIKKRRLRQN